MANIKKEKVRLPPSRLKPYCIGGLLLFMGLISSMPILARLEILNEVSAIMLLGIAVIGFFAAMVLAFLDYQQDYAKVVLIITTLFAGPVFIGLPIGASQDQERDVRAAALRFEQNNRKENPLELGKTVKLPRESLALKRETRADLPQQISIPLGNNVAMKLRLVPSGVFVMGAQMPPLPETRSAGGWLALTGAAAAWLWFFIQARRAKKNKRSVQFSLASYFLLMLMFSCVAGGLVWHMRLEGEWKRFYAALNSTPLDQLPPREVLIAKPFYMGETEVSLAQFASLMKTSDVHNGPQATDWYRAQEFCRKLSAQSGKLVRLPTEAEWEYAHVHDPDDFKVQMFEWCSDWYGTYLPGDQVDPKGAARGLTRVARIVLNIETMTSPRRRDQYPPDTVHTDLGFRIVCEAPE